MREIWTMQARFERRHGQSPARLIEHLRFRAGYDFLLLRCDSGEVDKDLGTWWTDFLRANPDDRHAMVQVRPASNPSGTRRRRSRRRGAARPGDGAAGTETDHG
jgi:poly(A) polymerase